MGVQARTVASSGEGVGYGAESACFLVESKHGTLTPAFRYGLEGQALVPWGGGGLCPGKAW